MNIPTYYRCLAKWQKKLDKAKKQQEAIKKRFEESSILADEINTYEDIIKDLLRLKP